MHYNFNNLTINQSTLLLQNYLCICVGQVARRLNSTDNFDAVDSVCQKILALLTLTFFSTTEELLSTNRCLSDLQIRKI